MPGLVVNLMSPHPAKRCGHKGDIIPLDLPSFFLPGYSLSYETRADLAFVLVLDEVETASACAPICVKGLSTHYDNFSMSSMLVGIRGSFLL